MEITGNLAFKPDTSHAIVGLVFSGFYSPRGLHVTAFLFRGGGSQPSNSPVLPEAPAH